MADPGRLRRERAFWDRQHAGEPDRAGPPAADHGPEARLWELAAALPAGTRLVSLGGGVDRWGVRLARRGLRVVSVDLSGTALHRTAGLARAGEPRPVPVQADAHRLPLADGAWDVVLARSALHHLEPRRAALETARVLRPGGILLALEPICRPGVLRWLHRRLPYRPQYAVTPDEIELGEPELEPFRRAFSRLELEPFGCLARPSVEHLLGRAGLGRLRPGLRRLDRGLLRRFPRPGRWAGQAVIRGVR